MSEATFRGTRTENACAVAVRDGCEVRELQPFIAGDGFEWGYTGAGPSALALALCIEALVLGGASRDDAVRRAREVYTTFKRLVVADLPHETWTLTAAEVRTWVERIESSRAEDVARGAHPVEEGAGAGAAHECPGFQARPRRGRGPGPCARCGRTVEEHGR